MSSMLNWWPECLEWVKTARVLIFVRTRRMSHDQIDPQSSAQSDEGPAIGSQRH